MELEQAVRPYISKKRRRQQETAGHETKQIEGEASKTALRDKHHSVHSDASRENEKEVTCHSEAAGGREEDVDAAVRAERQDTANSAALLIREKLKSAAGLALSSTATASRKKPKSGVTDLLEDLTQDQRARLMRTGPKIVYAKVARGVSKEEMTEARRQTERRLLSRAIGNIKRVPSGQSTSLPLSSSSSRQSTSKKDGRR